MSPNIAAPSAAPDFEERTAAGRSLRKRVPRSGQSALVVNESRTDPIDLILSQAETRFADFVPVRHSRMSTSAFTFYRGTAIVMAEDLAAQESTGLTVQLCGDAHLGNFGLFASPDRRLVFDVNDFDETFAGPFEWDVKRLVASFVLAARDSGLDIESQREVAAEAARAYRRAMREFAGRPILELWYQRMERRQVEAILVSAMGDLGRTRLLEGMQSARKRDAASAVRKLTELVDGHRRFRINPPDVIRPELTDTVVAQITAVLEGYRESLSGERRLLFDRFRVLDFAHKIVGVGSVGLYSWAVLLEGNDEDDVLMLQFKQAQNSVLEAHVGGEAPHAGRRVVEGQQLMQAASDIFLGWTTNLNGDEYYVRQLRDMKWSPEVTGARIEGLTGYARLTGVTLARAHARSADPTAIAGYLGSSDVADQAFADFGIAYADLAEEDFARFLEAIANGRVSSAAVAGASG